MYILIISNSLFCWIYIFGNFINFNKLVLEVIVEGFICFLLLELLKYESDIVFVCVKIKIKKYYFGVICICSKFVLFGLVVYYL